MIRHIHSASYFYLTSFCVILTNCVNIYILLVRLYVNIFLNHCFERFVIFYFSSWSLTDQRSQNKFTSVFSCVNYFTFLYQDDNSVTHSINSVLTKAAFTTMTNNLSSCSALKWKQKNFITLEKSCVTRNSIRTSNTLAARMLRAARCVNWPRRASPPREVARI